MKAKINKGGWLGIERAGEFRGMVCPYSPDALFCGDWCPLFGEPEIYYTNKGSSMEITMINLRLCKTTFDLPVNNFTDERQTNE